MAARQFKCSSSSKWFRSSRKLHSRLLLPLKWMALNDVNNTCDLYHDGWRQKLLEGKETSFDEVVTLCQELDILYCSFLSFWKLVLLSPCYCWRSWHAKSDWFPVLCYFCCCFILSSGNSSLGLNGVLHFPYRFFTLMVFSIFPTFFPAVLFFPPS